VESMTWQGLAERLWAWGGLFCHQDPARSAAFGGQPLPLCLRCTGLYLGALLGLGGLLVSGRTLGSRQRGRLETAALLVAPTVLDPTLQHLGAPTLGPAARCLLGACAGLGLVWGGAELLARRLQPPPARPWSLAARALPLGLALLWGAASLAPASPGAWWLHAVASLLGAFALLALICVSALGWLLPRRALRPLPWALASGAAWSAVLLALARLPSHWRNPFWWWRWLFG